MRRTPALAVGIAIAWAWGSGVARAGVWLTLAAGAPGSSTPKESTEFWFDTPHGPPVVAVNQLNGGLMVEAGTGGGTTFFGGAATPVLLNLADGSAYIAGGSPPADALTKGAGGGTRATAAPQAGGPIPSDAALLGITVGEPNAVGSKQLTATANAADGALLGLLTVFVPQDGWWVLGLGPQNDVVPPPPPIDPGPVTPPTDPVPVPTTPGPAAATPEPSTLVLLGIGGAVGAWRSRRRK